MSTIAYLKRSNEADYYKNYFVVPMSVQKFTVNGDIYATAHLIFK